MPTIPVAVWLLLAVLTVYRLAEFVAFDEGPFGFARWLRVIAGAYDLDSSTGEPDSALGRLFACPHCLGVWFAGFAVILFALAIYASAPPIVAGTAQFLLLWLGIAGAQSLLQNFSLRV